ncbi:MAG: hypothetical protein L3J37_07810 [Rhodobacteraceae bacterium]|nr:hypothetical protein [Paracoccaceae bacterium]
MKLPDPPKLVRFLIFHTANGIAIGVIFVFAIIWSNFLGVGDMLARDESGIATFILFFQTALTFGGVSAAIAVMNLGKDDD